MVRFHFGLLWLLFFFAGFDHMIPVAASDAADPDAGETGLDIEEGRKFWSFQPLGQFKPPVVERDDWARSPIDRFTLSRQEQERISPAAIVDRYKLIRRARFAESNGFEKDEDRPAAYHYRNFVIRSLNQDLPYDEFVQWQIAGDQLRPQDPLTRTATGFLVAGVENIVQSIKEFERDRYEKLDDMASTIGTTMLGLTIGCARCHDHKYDPISQRDYYRFVSSFQQTASREIMLSSQETGTKVYAAVDVGDEVRKVDQNVNVGTDHEKFVLEARVHFLERGDVNAKLEVATQSLPQVFMRGGFREDYWQKPTSANGQSPPPRVTLAHWVEQGVRFIQIYSGGTDNHKSWDAHNNLTGNHSQFAAETDQPIAALLADLKARGLFDSTLVVCGGEFGRTSDSQNADGRDHNPHAFTTWLAGGGVKGGVHYGSTDEFGYKAVQNRVSVHDLHATVMHLVGLDHERLTYRFNGRDQRLTDVSGNCFRQRLDRHLSVRRRRVIDCYPWQRRPIHKDLQPWIFTL